MRLEGGNARIASTSVRNGRLPSPFRRNYRIIDGLSKDKDEKNYFFFRQRIFNKEKIAIRHFMANNTE